MNVSHSYTGINTGKTNPFIKKKNKQHTTKLKNPTVKGLLTCSFSTFILSSSVFKLEMEAEKQEH